MCVYKRDRMIREKERRKERWNEIEIYKERETAKQIGGKKR